MTLKTLRILGISFASLSMMACASAPFSGKKADEPQFPYFGDIVPKTEIKDASLVEAPEPLEPIWQEEESGKRHRVSGALCPDSMAGFMRHTEKSFPGLPRGYDVACVYSAPFDAEIKVHFTHFGRDVSLDAHLKGVNGTIAEGYPVLGRTKPPTNVFGQTISTHQSGFRLRPEDPSDPLGETTTWIENIAGWHVKIRATFVETNRHAVGVAVGELLEIAREGMVDREQLIAANLP